MLCHYFIRIVISLYFVILIHPIFLIHTVALEKLSTGSHEDDSPGLSLNAAVLKKEKIVNISQTQSSNVSENYTALESANNRTSHSPSGELSSSKSLPPWIAAMKSGALERTGFVALGFMLIILVFFVVRTIRLRRKKSKSRKYGIITSTDMEMEPLDNDDDDEDTTLFDAQHKYSLQ